MPIFLLIRMMDYDEVNNDYKELSDDNSFASDFLANYQRVAKTLYCLYWYSTYRISLSSAGD